MDPQPAKRSKTAVIIVCIAVVLCAVMAAAMYRMSTAAPPESNRQIGYAEGTVVLDDSEPVEITPPEAMTLDYNGQATSTDGKNFQCYIANAVENQYDMYVDIYSDAALTDEIYLSGLFKPGTGLKELTLDRPLDQGSHTVYVVFTQMEDPETMHAQLVVTMEFTVQ